MNKRFLSRLIYVLMGIGCGLPQGCGKSDDAATVDLKRRVAALEESTKQAKPSEPNDLKMRIVALEEQVKQLQASRPNTPARSDGRASEARVTAAKTDVAMLESALDIFENDCGRYPSTTEGLGTLIQRPPNVDKWHGPYLKRMPNDPWNNPYVYRYPGEHNKASFDLHSLGPDGKEGGGDDIDNWTQ